MAIREVKIKDVLQELGLPAESKFRGYIVRLPIEDEFLSLSGATPAVTAKTFCKTPEAAKIYDDPAQAAKDAKSCKQRAEVCLLFEVGKQYAVAPIGN